MANNKSDKPLVRNMIIFCVGAILLFHFAWARQYFVNLGNALFTLVDLALLVAFTYMSVKAYNQADDPNKDWKRYAVVGITLASMIWAAGWAAGLNELVNL